MSCIMLLELVAESHHEALHEGDLVIFSDYAVKAIAFLR